jgi:hypothetical protein
MSMSTRRLLKFVRVRCSATLILVLGPLVFLPDASAKSNPPLRRRFPFLTKPSPSTGKKNRPKTLHCSFAYFAGTNLSGQIRRHPRRPAHKAQCVPRPLVGKDDVSQ